MTLNLVVFKISAQIVPGLFVDRLASHLVEATNVGRSDNVINNPNKCC